jgi:hypothetical protein
MRNGSCGRPLNSVVRRLMPSASEQLERAVSLLGSVACHASVRNADDGSSFAFAVGPRRLHSLELRQRGGEYDLSLWEGPDGNDSVAKRVTVKSFAAAIEEAERWLRNEDV